MWYGFRPSAAHMSSNLALHKFLTARSEYLHFALDEVNQISPLFSCTNIAQQDRMWFACPAIVMTLQNGFYGMSRSPPLRMHAANKSYPSLAKYLRAQSNQSLRNMSWREAPPASWTLSAGAVRHGIGEYSTGRHEPRDVGNADAIRYHLLKKLLKDTPANDLDFFHDLRNKTAAMCVFKLFSNKLR